MPVKLVIGLTDTLSNSIFSVSSNPYAIASPLIDIANMTEDMTRDSYNLLLLPDTVEQATLEWELDTELPAVNALLNMIDVIKTRPYFAKVVSDTRAVIGSYKDIVTMIEFVNVIPNREVTKVFYTEEDNNAVVTTDQEFGVLELDSLLGYEYQGVKEDETLTYAFNNDDLSMLREGPINRMVRPRFVFSFYTGQSPNPSTQMSILQQIWMKKHQDELAALGYTINDPTAKVGALPVGRLLGDPQEQYDKMQQFSKVCRIDIVRD
jgi:hypothetical protein